MQKKTNPQTRHNPQKIVKRLNKKMVATGSPRYVARRVGRWRKHRYPENETLVVRVQAHIERLQLCVSSVREVALADGEFREITDHVALTCHKAAVRDALADLISHEEPAAPKATAPKAAAPLAPGPGPIIRLISNEDVAEIRGHPLDRRRNKRVTGPGVYHFPLDSPAVKKAPWRAAIQPGSDVFEFGTVSDGAVSSVSCVSSVSLTFFGGRVRSTKDGHFNARVETRESALVVVAVEPIGVFHEIVVHSAWMDGVFFSPAP